MTSPSQLTIELVGEGRTDIGSYPGVETPGPPTRSVLGVLVHKLCGKPEEMRVLPRGYAFLAGRNLAQKVNFARRRASYHGHCLVFVIDSEGDLVRLQKGLAQGRDRGHAVVPTAVGVAHPCIEAWLLSDAMAIQRAMNLPAEPKVPHQPEALPSNPRNLQHPKKRLARCAGSSNPDLSAKDKTSIASAIDLDRVRERCPVSFAPFALEVETHIKPLFHAAPPGHGGADQVPNRMG